MRVGVLLVLLGVMLVDGGRQAGWGGKDGWEGQRGACSAEPPPRNLAPCLPACLPSPAALLERILELLLGFVRRTHQALAGVGVAALVRLIVAAGPHLDDDTWMMVRRWWWWCVCGGGEGGCTAGGQLGQHGRNQGRPGAKAGARGQDRPERQRRFSGRAPPPACLRPPALSTCARPPVPETLPPSAAPPADAACAVHRHRGHAAKCG